MIVNKLIEFVPGTKAVAVDVNNNFNDLLQYCQHLEERVNKLETQQSDNGGV